MVFKKKCDEEKFAEKGKKFFRRKREEKARAKDDIFGECFLTHISEIMFFCNEATKKKKRKSRLAYLPDHMM